MHGWLTSPRLKQSAEITMATLKKTAQTSAGTRPQPQRPSARIELATRESAPVDSVAHQLRLQLEAALAASPHSAALAEPSVEKWSGATRAVILCGAAILPWSLIALTVQAIIRHRLLP
jgi:hypothetical protein